MDDGSNPMTEMELRAELQAAHQEIELMRRENELLGLTDKDKSMLMFVLQEIKGLPKMNSYMEHLSFIRKHYKELELEIHKKNPDRFGTTAATRKLAAYSILMMSKL